MTASDSHEREHKKKNKKINKKIPSCHFLLAHSRRLTAAKTIATTSPSADTSPPQSTLAHESQYIPVHYYSSKTPFVSAYMRPPSHAKRSWFMYFFGPGGIRIPSVVFTFAGRKKHEKAPLPQYISTEKKNVPMLPLPLPPPSPK
jgi:hypothetical protein